MQPSTMPVNWPRKRRDKIALADKTGFSPEGVGKAFSGMAGLEQKLTPDDWKAESLFGKGSRLQDLFGVMFNINQLSGLKELTKNGAQTQNVAEITQAWVSGASIKEIATRFFEDKDITKAITTANRAIYRTLVNTGTWGLSALSQMAGLDSDSLPEQEKKNIQLLPAMLYYGVRTQKGY